MVQPSAAVSSGSTTQVEGAECDQTGGLSQVLQTSVETVVDCSG